PPSPKGREHGRRCKALSRLSTNVRTASPCALPIIQAAISRCRTVWCSTRCDTEIRSKSRWKISEEPRPSSGLLSDRNDGADESATEKECHHEQWNPDCC